MQHPSPLSPQQKRVATAADNACQSVTPLWPLDQFIAVNPWWQLTHRPLSLVAAQLASRSGAQALMPRHYYRRCYQRGQITRAHLQSVAAEHQGMNAEQLLAHIDTDRHTHAAGRICDLVDARRDLSRNIAWSDEIVHQISQFCGAFFDQYQAKWKVTTQQGLYRSWLNTVRHDRGIGLLMGEPHIHRQFRALPEDHLGLLRGSAEGLDLHPQRMEEYFHSLLLSINGWSSWCAYQRQQAERNAQDSTVVEELLAIRVAWDYVLYRHYHSTELVSEWALCQQQLKDFVPFNHNVQEADWLWQQALERSYQQQLFGSLSQAQGEPVHQPLKLQAVFCIDVRSEPYRRALESQGSGIKTLGYAGFFGLAAEYQPQGSAYCRPQLPGLLAPAYRVTESVPETPGHHRLSVGQAWQRFKYAAPSAFTFVETSGPAYALKLLKQSFMPGTRPHHPVTALAEGHQGGWELTDSQHPQRPVAIAARVDLAQQILSGMGLTGDFAQTVLLVGHGSESHNNPHAAGLDCGACGGQTGEVNSRVVADLLNDSTVRQGLAEKGIVIPQQTRFVAALHNTTTDEVKLFTSDNGSTWAQVRQWLQHASAQVRKERAASVFTHTSKSVTADELRAAYMRRSQDWSQVRPEWGLANNASFIIAPRSKTRGIDLQGRAFLHEYDGRQDADFVQLEQIMTAPMLVTHWINFQYYASVTDNLRYGSGNKVLHNVVGGNIGLFEGNGGDLRTGLSMQSVHDGQDWVHQPLRLSVVIDAPQQAIAAIVEKHQQLKQLVDNQWLYLFSGLVQPHRYLNGSWHRLQTVGRAVA